MALYLRDVSYSECSDYDTNHFLFDSCLGYIDKQGYNVILPNKRLEINSSVVKSNNVLVDLFCDLLFE